MLCFRDRLVLHPSEWPPWRVNVTIKIPGIAERLVSTDGFACKKAEADDLAEYDRQWGGFYGYAGCDLDAVVAIPDGVQCPVFTLLP